MGYATCGIMRGNLEAKLLEKCRHDPSSAITLIESMSMTMRHLEMDRHILDWVNCRDIDMRTPLHIASVLGRNDLIITLLREGANPNVVDNFEFAPLMRLCSSHHPDPDSIKAFVVCGCDINHADSIGRTPLFYAITHKHYDASTFLMLIGAHIHAAGYRLLSQLERHLLVLNSKDEYDMTLNLIREFHVHVSLRRIAHAHLQVLNHEN